MTDTPRPPEHPVARLIKLVLGNFDAPPGAARIAAAIAYGLLCHLIFAAAVIWMFWTLYNGMSTGLGTVLWPWAALTNFLLLAQFPVLHSLLLNGRLAKLPARVFPEPYGSVLASTSYTIFASLQLLALFVLWTPSGIVWWQAEGWALVAMTALNLAAWGFLMKSNLDAGAELQSGALGWMSLLQKVRPRYPDMPTHGIFRYIRQPIYLGFSLTLWTVPTWTPDQLVLALGLTAYCLIAPRKLKERRYAKRHGARFTRYQEDTGYMFPKRGSNG
ncbi:hypothetical protein FIU97_05530 [Roseivivax sp. THAF40]|uniref:methyltransferase family protein n=1 Tax=unclassified Roseivivax TaxID=2639302 RepID=UPI0012691F4F|nr:MULTISPECIES: isoprenylcysteine carboxylmethyltransferase family protein [unclassified Roseivivax]QFS82235.1 hypothetical protein FIV09_05270 [Roseivivax sp. THAF197b]QFT46035.1 hypothetical protein FIU97_05530 [Roseivivax sp. THAF40]